MAEIDVLPQFKPLYEPHAGVILAGGRARGASTAMAQAVVYFGSKFTIKIVLFREFLASIKDSAKAQIEGEIENLGLSHEWTITDSYLRHRKTQTTIKFKGLQRNKSSIKSLYDTDWAIVEEAEDLSFESWKILEPTIRKPGSTFTIIGNPRERASCFGHLITELPRDWVLVMSTYLENPYASEEILRMAQECKTNNPGDYDWIWLGNFREAGLSRMITKITHPQPGEVPDPLAQVVIGCDIARSGGDRTAIAVRKGSQIVYLQSWATMDLPQLTAHLSSLIRKYSPSQISIDATGHGAWLPDALDAKGIKVKSVVFSETAEEAEKYSNRRTEIYGRLEWFMTNGGTVPQNTELVEELEASFYTLDNRDRRKMLPKDDIKRRIKRSPDLADAVALACDCYEDVMFSTVKKSNLSVKIQGRRLISAGRWGK
jgi:phage terminase large subunit